MKNRSVEERYKKRNRKNRGSLLFLLMLTALAAGCKGSDRTEEPADQTDQADQGAETYAVAEEKADAGEVYRSLEEWEGSWESFVNYCQEEDLAATWEAIAEETEIEVDRLKDTFSQLCFVTDDIKYFEIKDGTVSGLDSDGNLVFENQYVLIDQYDENSDQTVIEGEVSYLLQAERESGRYNYLCFMPICMMEENQKGMKMLKHFHFNYGATIEEATDRSGIPTLLEGTSDVREKEETMLTFFLGNEE